MSENSKVLFSDFIKKCNLLNTITNIDVRLIDQEEQPILQLVSHHIPVALQNFDEEYLAINEQLRKSESHNCYHHVNRFNLEYIASGIWHNNRFHGSILIGPFVSNESSMGLISDILSENKIPVSERKQLDEFYRSLSIISGLDANSIGELLVNLCANRHIQGQLITADVIRSPLNREQVKNNIAENKYAIETRNQLEKELMDAVSKGDKEKITRMSNENNHNSLLNFADRIPESPMRSAKNITLVMNTILRIAAERGGVHPIYIHTISEKFAILIERAPNLPHLKNLGMVMVYEYCDVVSTFSTRHYSPIVKKAVGYIHLHLEDVLTLNKIAGKIHVNASYLSRKFKADTGMTIIDYINGKRVDEAKLYLQRGTMSITEIALMVGFNDLNYFSRVFKKVTFMSPSEYSKRIT